MIMTVTMMALMNDDFDDADDGDDDKQISPNPSSRVRVFGRADMNLRCALDSLPFSPFRPFVSSPFPSLSCFSLHHEPWTVLEERHPFLSCFSNQNFDHPPRS